MNTPRLFKRDDSGRILPPENPGWRERPYYFQVQIRRKRYLRCLDTNDAGRAGALARLRAKELQDAVLRGDLASLKGTPLRAAACATIGQIMDRYIERAAGVAGIRLRTVRGNIGCLALVVRRVMRQDCDVRSLPATRLDSELGETFKRHAMDAAGSDYLARRSASISVNSNLRQARSLFAKKLGSDFYAGLVLPASLPKFLAVRMLPIDVKRFRRPDPVVIERTRAASVALREVDANAYLAFLLGLGCGLRKNELAHARVSWLEAGFIRVQTEADFCPKDHEERRIPLEPWLVIELSGLLSKRLPGAYILDGNLTERVDHTFRRLNRWLSSQGWDRRLKTHELRKLFGDLIAEQAGIRAAQCLLGHASITMTESYYADPATGIVPFRIFQSA